MQLEPWWLSPLPVALYVALLVGVVDALAVGVSPPVVAAVAVAVAVALRVADTCTAAPSAHAVFRPSCPARFAAV